MLMKQYEQGLGNACDWLELIHVWASVRAPRNEAVYVSSCRKNVFNRVTVLFL